MKTTPATELRVLPRQEAFVSVNGVPLTAGQVMTLRVALSSFLSDYAERGENALGADKHGREMVRLYTERGREVEGMLLNQAPPVSLTGGTMSEHDRVRKERALACDTNDLDSVRDALIGLQSTDDPSLLPLHDTLTARYRELESQGKKK